ncbi:MAG: flagellar hook-associated protein FlgK [Alphaproteobacteria bacterium]|nr:flagellar hook-associated protein FlgK [Alphaproteobacteria bacterium]
MSGLSQLLQTGLSGLSAATEAIQTVSNNTANVNTPGYAAQSVSQIELPGTDGGPGTGTDVTSVQRAFDQFIYQQGVQAASANQAAQVAQTNAQNIAALFPTASGGAGGLGAALGSFFLAANQVAQDPSSEANRQAFLGQAKSLTAAFNSLGGQIATNLDSIDNQASAAVQQVNGLTQQIAQLNQAILAQTGAAAGPPNSLLDQRDQLVQQLAQELGVTTVAGANGVVDVYTSGGAALVNGATAYQLGAGQSQYGDGAISLTYVPTGQDITATLSDGTLGGLLAARDQLVSAGDSVGALAAAIAAAVNTQQSLGLDQNGNLGQPLFSVAGPAIYASQRNTGTGSLTAAITDPANFTPDDFILTDTAGGFEGTDTATGEVTALGSGPTLSFDGLTIAVSGAVASGDTFKIEPTATAAQTLTTAISDPSAIAAASAYVASPGANVGNVQATVGAPVASSSLPAGAIVLPASQFGQTFSVQFTSNTNFNVLSNNNTVIASGTLNSNSGAEIAVAYPGSAPAGEVVPISLSAGSAAAGDRFTLSPGGAGSNGNMVGLANLADQNLLSGQTFSNFYSTLVTNVGSRSQEAQAAAQATQAVLTQTQNAQQSVSGVNLDQQAADLVGYQQAYQAAAKLIATAQTLFQSLLEAV